MNHDSCSTCLLVAEKDPTLFLTETPYWQIYLSDKQNYPGRCFVPLKRHAASLGELTDAEILDFKRIAQALETVYFTKLGARPLNYSCLMNGAYQETDPHPHVHFHVIPRFQNAVEFGGMLFEDKLYGFNYTREYEWVLNAAGSNEIKELVQNELIQLLTAQNIPKARAMPF